MTSDHPSACPCVNTFSQQMLNRCFKTPGSNLSIDTEDDFEGMIKDYWI